MLLYLTVIFKDLKEKCLDILDSNDHVKNLESLFARYANVMKSF